jgi:apolipoprotein N-acyltransferase
MPNQLRTLHKWKQTRKGLLIAAVVELILAYGFASWAIDSGNLWLYLLALILVAGSLRNLLKLGLLAIGKR